MPTRSLDESDAAQYGASIVGCIAADCVIVP